MARPRTLSRRLFRKLLAAGVAIAALAAAACATSPANVQPAYVSPTVYAGLSCAELQAEDARLAVALANVYRRQNRTRAADTWGVFLIGVPVGTVAGNNVAGQVAQVKGAQATLRQVMSSRACPSPAG